MKNNDPELLQSILLERLGDCSSRIVEQILGFDGLVDIVQHSSLGQALIAVAKKYWRSYSLVSKCLEIILELLANSTSLEGEIEVGCLEILIGSFFVTREVIVEIQILAILLFLVSTTKPVCLWS